MSSPGRILLVFPRAFERNSVPPLGIALLAACLREAGHAVDLLDLTVEPLGRRDFRPYCLIGMTLLCTNFQGGVDVARQVRRQIPRPASSPGVLLPTPVLAMFSTPEFSTLSPMARARSYYPVWSRR